MSGDVSICFVVHEKTVITNAGLLLGLPCKFALLQIILLIKILSK